MPRLAAPDIAAVATFARGLDERSSAGVASSPALDSMLALIRADTIEWGITDERDRRLVEIRHYPPLLILRGSEPFLANANEAFWAARPPCPICGSRRIRYPGAVRISDLGDISQAHPQHFVCAGIPVAHQMNLFMRPGDILPRHVAFSRADGIDFDVRDAQVLELAGAFMVQQARVVEARNDAAAAIAAFETTREHASRGLIVIRDNERPALVSAEARRLLHGYFAWNPNSRRLPAPVETWLAEAAALERQGTARGAASPLRRVARAGEVLLRTIAVDGQVVVVVDHFPGDASDPRSLLTARERDVLDRVAEGLTNAQIADRLWLSPGTVGKHLENAFAKLGVHSRAGAVAMLRGFSQDERKDRLS